MDRLPGEPIRLVIALGGNAVLRRGDSGGIEEQFFRADAVMRHIADIAERGHRLVITHGNGPVVGNIVLRNEAARDTIPPMPLFIDDADSEGGIGFMLQMALYNCLHERKMSRAVYAMVTQVIVAADDPAFRKPTKPIGPYYTAEGLRAVKSSEPDWVFAEVGDRRWRRVVPSPRPLRIVEASAITRMSDHGDIVIAAGGGGVPVIEEPDGMLSGVDAVVDKDWSSAVLALQTGAQVLAILMEEDRVYTGYGTSEQKALTQVGCVQLRRLIEAGEFPAGSMLPKVEAAVHFVEHGGRETVICRAEDVTEALSGRAGTHVVR